MGSGMGTYVQHTRSTCLSTAWISPLLGQKRDLTTAICARSDGRRGVRLRPTVAIYPNGGTAGSGARIHLQVGMVVVREACLGAVQTEEWRFKPRDREHLWR